MRIDIYIYEKEKEKKAFQANEWVCMYINHTKTIRVMYYF